MRRSANLPLAQIRDLSFTSARSDQPSLTGIDVTLFAKRLSILVGPTGCGKSTFALSLNGLIPNIVGGQMKGRVVVDGFDTRDHPVYEMATKVGLLFQDPEAQLCNLFGEDEIAFGCENLKIRPQEIAARIKEVAQILGMEGILHTPVHSLSLGQKQRIALAAVLAMKPRLLVLDEPLSNLDPQTGMALIRTIDRRFRDPFDGVLFVNRGGEFTLRSIAAYGTQ